MESLKIFDLFGYSEDSPEIKQLFKELNIPLLQPEILISWTYYISNKWNLKLVFRAKNNFICDYGQTKQTYSESYDESFLEEINFGGDKGNTNYPFTLPWNLCLSDEPENVKEKVDIKTSKFTEATYGNTLFFYSEDYELLTRFDKNNKLIWIRVKLLELSFKKKRELTKSLKQQNKNISAINSKKLIELKRKSPTSNWKVRMTEGDQNFTDKSISDTDLILHGFIDNLISASEQKKANSVYSSVRKVVLSINKLNDKHDSFIETLEREELVEYIHQAVRLTGFKIDNGLDLTEEWREW